MKISTKALILIAALTLLVRPTHARDRDIIITTDCGTEVDDQFAIAYMAMIPEVHIKGIVTTHAPGLQDQAKGSASCAKNVLERLGVPAVPPIFPGSNVALTGRTPLRNAGADFIVTTARSYSAANRLVIVTLGATTDVASAFLSDRSMGDRVEILTMGFDDWPKGGDPWNIKNDPLAYQVILDSPAPITIGSTAVTRKYLELSDTEAQHMLSQHGSFAAWLNGLFQNWVTGQADLVAQVVRPRHWVIWDTVTAAHLLGFTKTETHPRPSLNPVDLTFSFPATNTKKTIEWITWIDSPKMWPDFMRRIDRADVAFRAAHPAAHHASN
jgi:inosine-uridine nucleoside N-ribohydrolase